MTNSKKKKRKRIRVRDVSPVSDLTDTKKNNAIKIFVVYYKPNILFQTKIFQPILTSTIDWSPEGIIHDNTGDNIAERNMHYGELSGHYWVWKNFLPKTDVDYVGFCHYRRFLDFNITPSSKVPFKPVYIEEFRRIFKRYTEKTILKYIHGYDIILPYKFYFPDELYGQYIKYHPQKDLDLAMEAIKKIYPEYYDIAQEFIKGTEQYICLNFIMKRELLNEYFEWIFNILFYVENKSDWSKYTEYLDIRVPAYIAERLFNVWLIYNVKKRNLKVKDTSSIFIIGKDYVDNDPNSHILKYKIFTEYFKQFNIV